jgi:hypothetical protein
MCSLVEKQEPFRLAEDQCLAAVNSAEQHVQQAMPAVVNAMSTSHPAAPQLSHSGPQAGEQGFSAGGACHSYKLGLELLSNLC